MNERPSFTTTSGKTYFVHGVSYDLIQLAKANIEKRYRAEGQPIDPPTYQVTTASGVTETHPHTPKSEKTSEEQEAWDAHIRAVIQMRQEQQNLETMMWLDGVEFDVDPAWVKRHERYGIELPEDEDEKKTYFLGKEVLISGEDVIRAMEAVQKISLAGIVPEDEISALMDSFRNQLQASYRSAFDLVEGRTETAEELPEVQRKGQLGTLGEAERISSDQELESFAE